MCLWISREAHENTIMGVIYVYIHTYIYIYIYIYRERERERGICVRTAHQHISRAYVGQVDLDGVELTRIMHTGGIPMRHLGRVKMLLLHEPAIIAATTEMVARLFKV